MTFLPARRPAVGRKLPERLFRLPLATATMAAFALSAAASAETRAQTQFQGIPGMTRPQAEEVPTQRPGDHLTLAAVVNDQPVTMHDLEARMRFLMLVSGFEDTPDMRRELRPRVLRQLIDERLQMQEAARLGIVVSERELREAVSTIEEQNGLPEGSIGPALAEAGVDPRTLAQQLTATLAWQEVLRARVSPQVDVGEEEVDAYLEELRERGGTTEWSVAEIFIAATDPAQQDTARQTAERVIQQLREGTPFAALARQFSDASTAAIGGDLGIVRSGQLDPRLESALEEIQPGQVAGPIATETGFTILLLRDEQTLRAPRPEDDRVEMARLFLELPSQPSEDQVARAEELAIELSGTLRNCRDLRDTAQEISPGENPTIGPVAIGALPPVLRDLILQLDINRPSPPIRLDEGLIVLMVCERIPAQGDLPSREEIRQALGQQRIEQRAQRYLADLRLAAFIDIRV